MSELWLKQKQRMKSWITVVVTWVIILQSPVRAVTTYELDLEGITSEKYSEFLQKMRDDVTQPGLHYGDTDIPVIIEDPNPEFLRVDIKYKGIVSIAVRRKNLYVLAYLAKDEDQQFRVYYFEEKITPLQLDVLFPEAQGRYHDTGYGDSYPELERKADTDRKKAGLGIERLINSVAEVNGVARNIKEEAVFILFAAEMVAEATRFKYTEDVIVTNFHTDIQEVPNRVIIMENSWGPISRATKISVKGKFKKPLVLKSSLIKTETWTVNNVGEVNMGILLHVRNNVLLWIIGIILVLLVAFLLMYYLGFFKAKSHRVKKTD